MEDILPFGSTLYKLYMVMLQTLMLVFYELKDLALTLRYFSTPAS